MLIDVGRFWAAVAFFVLTTTCLFGLTVVLMFGAYKLFDCLL